MLRKKKTLSIRFYTVLLLMPFLIAIFILVAFLRSNFNTIEQKSNYILEKTVPDVIATQNIQQKLQDLQRSIEIIRFSNDFTFADEAYNSSRLLNISSFYPYKDEIKTFKERIAKFYKDRMDFYALRRGLFIKVNKVNEIGNDVDFYQELRLMPMTLYERKNDELILKTFKANYKEIKRYCVQDEIDKEALSSCSVLLSAYEDLKVKIDKLYAKKELFEESYLQLNHDLKEFSILLSGKHNYSLVKDIFEIEDTVEEVQHMVRAAVIIAVIMVIAEIFLIHFLIISPIYKIAKEIREFRRTKLPPKKLMSWHIEEIQDICSLLNPLFKDVSEVYSESFELQKQNQDLKSLALLDDLTQLLNRRALNLLIREKPFARKNMAVCMLDIDYFKCLNDSMGHIEGDRVLHRIAVVLKEKVAGSDLIYRYGGEEFCIILFDVKQEDVLKIAKRLCKEIESLNLINKGICDKPVTISAGTSLIAKDDKSDTIIDLIHQADSALYRAKNSGRNCAVSYEEVLKL